MAQQPFDLYALDPAAKRAMEAQDRFKADLKTKNKFRARPQTGATASAPRRGGVERTADRLAAFGVPISITEAIKDVDRNLLGADETAQSLRNIITGDATAGDYVNAALSAPVIGGLAAKPVEMLAAKAGRGLARVGKRALASRAGRYLTEARPVLDNADDAIETAFTVTPGAQRRITNQRPVVQGLPAPEQRLALPAPGPGLPSFAVKPRGGQWWPNIDISEPYSAPRNYSPEYAVQRTINNQFVGDLTPEEQALRDWFEKAATRYIKTDLGSPEDPLRAVAEQGNLHLAGMTPDQWSHRARMNIYAEPIGYYTVPPSAPEQTEAGLIDLNFGPEQREVDQLLGAAPWLRKAPVTDQLHGLSQDVSNQLGFRHLLDEMGNALNPQSGLPPELLLDPKSLQRMGLAQASERVGLINQFRAKQAEQAKLNAVDNPATYTFKEYPENNPRGLRWVELKAPENISVPGDWVLDPDTGRVSHPNGLKLTGRFNTNNWEEAAANAERERALQEALRYEGDTMGHCVGGYCDDVASGRSRIFSLRDAKGEPHVTIETAPKRVPDTEGDYFRYYQQAAQELGHPVPRNWQDFADDGSYDAINRRAVELSKAGPAVPIQDIVQIKGKQNRAPKDDYLPFVQDFVKSGQWGQIGDFANTGLVKLPDGRYITTQQLNEAVASPGALKLLGSEENARSQLAPWNINTFSPEDWEQTKHLFEGYARGGRALAVKPCSCDHSFAVR